MAETSSDFAQNNPSSGGAEEAARRGINGKGLGSNSSTESSIASPGNSKDVEVPLKEAPSGDKRATLRPTNSQRLSRMISTSLRNLTDALIAQIFQTSQKPPIVFHVAPSDLSTLASERTPGALATVLETAMKGEKNAVAGGEKEVDQEDPSEGSKIAANLEALISKIRKLEQTLESNPDEATQLQMDVARETAANALTSLVLKSSPETGLDLDTNPGQVQQRIQLFGANSIAPKRLTSFLEFCWGAIQDFVLIMLICLGVVGIVTETIIGHDDGPCGACWVEGAAILVAVAIVVLVTATIDYQKQKTFVRLSKTLDDSNTKSVIRNGQVVSVTDAEILVGDILSVNSHNLASIPADCVLLGPMTGAYLKMDESALTGESKLVSKKPGDVILSGTSAVQGSGKLLVIAVGVHSVSGKIKARVYESEQKSHDGDDLQGDDETPLFSKLETLAKQIGIAGTIAAVTAFLACLILGLVVKGDPPTMIIDYFMVSVTVLAVAVPEGLPLAVTLALAFSSSKMTQEQNLVKHLDACETMGCATTICTDKTGKLERKHEIHFTYILHLPKFLFLTTGTLTANKMTARAMYINGTDYTCSDPTITLASELRKPLSGLPASMLQLLTNLISVCTMNETVLHVQTDEKTGKNSIVGGEGNPTEVALLQLVHELGSSYQDIRSKTLGRSDVGDLARFLGEGKQFDFTSARKMMSWAVPNVDSKGNKGYRIYCKGASEVIAARCNLVLTDKGEIPMTESISNSISNAAERYARKGMRCLSLAYRDLAPGFNWDAKSATLKNSDGTPASQAETELVFCSLAGIEDPLRPDVPPAIKMCYGAGIDVRMVTGDNPNTAVSIAHQAGILRDEHFTQEGVSSGEYVADNLKQNVLLEGKVFREKVYRMVDGKKEFDQAEFDKIWPHLRVLARSSPDDKLTLAHGLNQSTLFMDKEKCKQLLNEHNIRIFPDRQVVAMTGDGTNDAPALKRADIGFAMGIAGTQIAKDAADIILLDDNFASIVTAAKWGRNIYASIQKFLQFQLTVNLAAVTTTLVGAFVNQVTPLAAIQLLWVNLIMDSLASLALASEPPKGDLLSKPPVNRTEHLITKRMWANLIGHAIYQIVVVLLLFFKAPEWFGMTPGYDTKDTVHFTLIFNSFVWMQLFNEINCRNLKGERNVFAGILNNSLFCGIWITTACLQVIIVQFGSVAMAVAEGGLDGPCWAISLGFGVGSFPIQQLINLVFSTCQKYRIVRDRKRIRRDQRLIRQNISDGVVQNN